MDLTTRDSLPELIANLSNPDEDICAEAATKLGRLGESGQPAVESLIRLSLENNVRIAYDSIWALGEIGGERAVSFLTSRLEAETNELLLTGVIRSLGTLKLQAVSAIPTLENLEMKEFNETGGEGSSISYWLKDTLQIIRSAVRFHNSEMQEQSFTQGRMLLPSLHEQVNQLPVVDLNSSGKILDRQFYFARPGDSLSAARLRLFRTPIDGKFVAIATNDEFSFGNSVTNTIEYIASTVNSRLGIKPQDILWVQHYAPSFGLNSLDEFSAVTFGSNNGHIVESPGWTVIKDPESFFSTLGINSL